MLVVDMQFGGEGDGGLSRDCDGELEDTLVYLEWDGGGGEFGTDIEFDGVVVFEVEGVEEGRWRHFTNDGWSAFVIDE